MSHGLTILPPLSTNPLFKNKLRMLCFPMDFGDLNIDGLTERSVLSSAIPETELRKLRLLAPRTIFSQPLSSTWVLNRGCQRPTKIIFCNSRNAIRNRWLYSERRIHSQDKPFRPFAWSFFKTANQYNTRYASRNLDFRLLGCNGKMKILHNPTYT